MKNKIELNFPTESALLELVSVGINNFKNNNGDPNYISQICGNNLYKKNQSFIFDLPRNQDLTKPISFQIYFKNDIHSDNLRQYIGNHLEYLEFSCFQERVLYKIDKFLLINLTPKIIKLDNRCIDINIPWTELGFADIKTLCMSETLYVIIKPMISDFNEIIDIIFVRNSTYLDTIPRSELFNDIHNERIMRFESHIIQSTKYIKLDWSYNNNTTGLLITSNNILPKINKIKFNTQEKKPEKISDNMYFVPYIDDNKLIHEQCGQLSVDITLETECENVLIYRIFNVIGIIDNTILKINHIADIFHKTSTLKCIYPSKFDELTEHKFTQLLLKQDKDKLLESIIKDIVIEI
jgi:hypothetical protein